GERNIDYPFQVKHYAQLLAERIQAGQFSFTHDIGRQCTYHDPCHMGRAGHVFEEPRTLLRAIPGANFREMRFHHEDAHCCGAVISLVADPDIAARVGAVRLQEAVECGADTVVTACPCCRVQLKLSCDKAGLPLQVRDLATLAAEALGRPEPSSDAVMDERWAVFDAMIRMMTPWGMAEMMATMIPEMIEAMPDTYRAMMKAVIASPAALREPMLAAMKGVMPSLFPVLLPGMMPRIMPTMLEKVKAAIPMPAYLQEQMPDLMPRAMEVLMPKMLPEIIPYFLPRMLDYLRTAAQQA
ncbi:MAG: (Fe-S)-binding protein, partial [Syntrophomonadaceae bacterium]|nr:(Fe-S)-binding protein [Syntrophomonadaceae bacterium]